MKRKLQRPAAAPRAPRAIASALTNRIYRVVKDIPRGRVCTYGWVAERAGLPRRARLVGQALSQSPRGLRLPWHRVINAQGRISFPARSAPAVEQRRRLEAEGVVFLRGRVNLERYGWRLTLDELLWAPPDEPAVRRT
jgi:methylated-DNA-protein-cysteine methyltransferase related protein